MDLTKLSFEELIDFKNKVDRQVESFKDGYFYIGLIARKLSFYKEEYNNQYMANKAEAESDYGDNYLIKIYTNNPNTNFFFIENRSEVPRKYTVG